MARKAMGMKAMAKAMGAGKAGTSFDKRKKSANWVFCAVEVGSVKGGRKTHAAGTKRSVFSLLPNSLFAPEGKPRGFKSIAHLETLRTSNPDYGSLYPSERTNCAEVSYDPLKRFAALVEKRPRGFKSVEHLEILRTSDPCYGSLAPSDRPGVAEHSYAPMARFRSLQSMNCLEVPVLQRTSLRFLRGHLITRLRAGLRSL